MTTLEDDESLERELFTRRERALHAVAAPPVPRLEDVLREAASAGGPRGSNVVPLTRVAQLTSTSDTARRAAARAHRPSPSRLRAVLLVAACAAAMVAVAPQLRHLVAAAPEATIRPEPAPSMESVESVASVPSASMTPAISSRPAPAAAAASTSSAISSSVDSDVCGGEPGTSSDRCESSCTSDSE
jgi:hypothetical protein